MRRGGDAFALLLVVAMLSVEGASLQYEYDAVSCAKEEELCSAKKSAEQCHCLLDGKRLSEKKFNCGSKGTEICSWDASSSTCHASCNRAASSATPEANKKTKNDKNDPTSFESDTSGSASANEQSSLSDDSEDMGTTDTASPSNANDITTGGGTKATDFHLSSAGAHTGRTVWEHRKRLIEAETADLNVQVNNMIKLRTIAWQTLGATKNDYDVAHIQLLDLKEETRRQEEVLRKLKVEIERLRALNETDDHNCDMETASIQVMLKQCHTSLNLCLSRNIGGPTQSDTTINYNSDNSQIDNSVQNNHVQHHHQNEASLQSSESKSSTPQHDSASRRLCAAKGATVCCTDSAAPPVFVEGECRGRFCEHLCREQPNQATSICGCECGANAPQGARAQGCSAFTL